MMAETPISTFRLDNVTKARLEQYAASRKTTMTDAIRKMVEEATMEQVTILSIDTKPEHDPYQNLTGVSSHTELRLDPRDRTAHVYQDYKTNSSLMTVYNGVELEFAIYGHPDEDGVRDYLTTGHGQELLQAICNGHEVVWNGSNHVGRLTDDAAEAVEQLSEYLSYWEPKYTYWSADEWMYDGATETVTAGTTDEELAELAKEFAELANAENIVLDEDILDWLTNYRDQQREMA